MLLLAASVSGCGHLGIGDDDPGSREGHSDAPPRVVATFAGLDARQERNVRAHLGLLEEPCDAPEWRVQRRFAAVDGEIGRALRALGHYRPKVEKHLTRDARCWQSRIDVTPGAQVLMSAVEVSIAGEAGSDPAFTALLAQLPLQQGDALDHGAYERAKRQLESLASARGYLNARFTLSELVVDPDAGTAIARLRLDPGPRYRFGALSIEQDVLDEDLVRRLLEYTPGDTYSAERLHQMDRALNDSGYFSSVDVRANPAAAQDLGVPVTVQAEARKRHLYSAGAGFATDVGPRVRLGYENRRINRSGHRLNARLRASPVEQDLTAEYQIPRERPRSEWLTFSAALVNTQTDTFDSTGFTLGARATRLRFGGWLQTAFIEASREDFEIGATRDTSTFLLPGVSYARTVSDDALRTERGWRLFAEIRGGAEGFGSDTSLLRARLSAGSVRTLPWRGRIITRAEVGALASGDFDKLPPSLRFFAGGDNSVRGYDFDTLGPRDATGQVIGGRYLAVASLEYEHPVRGAWSAATFIDAGNAFDNEFSEDIKLGVGVGVRWQSPVGPVRVDLAHPLNDDGDTLVRLHVRVGPDL
jgi:translocation and assembly module TamA